jgi:hypothetical protein
MYLNRIQWSDLWVEVWPLSLILQLSDKGDISVKVRKWQKSDLAWILYKNTIYKQYWIKMKLITKKHLNKMPGDW